MTSIRNRETAAYAGNTDNAGRETLNAAAQGAQRLTDQVTQMFGLTGGRSEEFTRRSVQSFELMTEASTVMARGFQDISREWFTLMQEQTQNNIDGFSALVRCRSVPELLSAHAELVRDSLQQTIDGTRRMADVSTRMVATTSQTVTAQANNKQRAA